MPACLAGNSNADEQRPNGDLCAVAAVSALLQYHGKTVPVEDVQQRLNCAGEAGGAEYANMAQMREVFRSYGLRAQSVRSSPWALRTLPMPAILYIRPERLGQTRVGHVVVLRSVHDDSVEIVEFSGGVGARRIPSAELRDGWDGELLIVSKEPLSSYPSSWTLLVLTAGFALLALSWLARCWKRKRTEK